MVFDTLENAGFYTGISTAVGKALRALLAADLAALPDGPLKLGGFDANILCYKTGHVELPRADAHKRFIDLQCILEGEEGFALGFLRDVECIDAYDRETDVAFYEGALRLLALRTGEFLLLYPQDAHAPGLAIGESRTVRKLVVKIPVAEG